MKGYQEFLIVGLPAFPTSKSVVVTCTSCKKYFPPSTINNEMYHGVQYIKNKTKPSIWMYSLPLVIIFLFLLMYISPSHSEREEDADNIEIKKDDIYTIETTGSSRRKYKKLRVLFVRDDSVALRESGHKSVKYEWLDKINNFHGDTILISKEDLLMKYQTYE
jgi:hypothetical protein